MRLFLRIAAFIIGIAGTTLLVGVLDELWSLAWLTLSFGLAVTIVVSYQAWLKAAKLSVTFCISVTVGLTLMYCLSVPPVITRLGLIVPKAIRLAFLVGFVGSTLIFIARGLFQKKTGAMTAWLLIPIMASLVLGVVSGGAGGADHMVHWAMRTFHMTQGQAETAVLYLRKAIHLTAYGTLGLSLFRGAIAGRTSKKQAILFALSVVACFATFDELRQSTVANRTGSAWDVGLDMVGALFFVLISAARVRGLGARGSDPTVNRPAKNAV